MNLGRQESKTKAESLVEEKLETFSQKETEDLIKDFQKNFDECVKSCKKPNILVSGITGAGKSTIINSIFGEKVAKSGVGLPITENFQKFVPKDDPIVLYDSKGLEWNEHEKYIKETTKFFNKLRASKELSEHIHCIWYLINAGRGRIDPFELKLIKEVFSPTPVIFILNKADLADSKQINALLNVIKDEKISNNKGVFVTVANRKTYTQAWCPKCFQDDVFYDEETKEIECCKCDYKVILGKTLGLEKVVEVTCELLPEFAKDAFTYCQKISQIQKDKRAKSIVKNVISSISLDIKGMFMAKLAEMFAKLFIIWGYPLTGSKFRDELKRSQQEYLQQLKFQERLFFSSIDTLFKKKISKGFTGLLGLTMNKGMKKLNEQLILSTKDGKDQKIEISDFLKDADLEETLIMLFFETTLFEGVEVAVEKYWSVTPEELEELKKKSKVIGDVEPMFKEGKFDVKNEEYLKKIFNETMKNGGESMEGGNVDENNNSSVKIEFIDENKNNQIDDEEEEEGEDNKDDVFEQPELD